MAGWQTGGGGKPGVITLELPARAVAVVQFGGLPKVDSQASNMAEFIPRNYGAAGAKSAKKFKLDSGAIEMRRSVAASGNSPLSIIRDIATAAKALKSDKAKEKAVVLVLHGNPDGLSRIYRSHQLEDMLTNEQLRGVWLFNTDLEILEKGLARREAELTVAEAKNDREAIEDARFNISDTRSRIADLKSHPANADVAAMHAALQSAAKALEEAGVGVVEIQACNVGQVEGVSTFAFSGRLQSMLETPTHTIQLRTHRRYVSTWKDGRTGKVSAFLGADRTAIDTNEISSTTLPPFVDQ